MKKFFALILALVMALSLTTVAWGATTDVDVATESDLTSAINNAVSGDIVNITLTDSFTMTTTATVADGVTVNLNMNGKAITATDTKASGNYEVFYIFGVMTVTGNGTITLTATTDRDWNALSAIFHNRGGVLTIENGTFTHNGGTDMAYVVDNSGNYYGDATTYVKGGTLTSSYIGIRNRMEQNSHGASGTAYVYVSGGTITGTSRSIWGQASSTSDTSPSTGVIEISGGTLNGKLEVKHGTGTESSITISAGTVNGDIKCEASDLEITGGTVTGTLTPVDESGTTVTDADIISGGTFSTDVSAYVVDDKQLLANGTVVDTPAANSTAPVLYVADNSTAGWATYCIATGADLDDLKQGADENCLPCYLINGDYYTEVSPAVAVYKLVYGAKTVYLNPVDSTDVCYDAEASVFTNVTKKTDQCGKLVVTDTTKTYYVFYDELDDDEDYYFVATKNGSIQLLVNGKIVDVELHTVQALTAHKWVGYDVTNNAYTSVKCENCEKVAKLYANKTAAGKNAVYVDDYGWITAASAALPGTVVTPSTDKTVTSADTFDAGIAMYVGMSVMAAAGSAVVIGKKKD